MRLLFLLLSPMQEVGRALRVGALRNLRYERGWSQERLVEKARTHRTYLAGIEVGKRTRRFGTSFGSLEPMSDLFK